MSRERYAIVGTGGRCVMFVDAIAGTYSDHAELVGLCDVNATRMDFYNRHIKDRYEQEPLPTYHANDFDRMIAEQRPDTVIVTTMDCTHHTYITRAMELGCNAITEKPMTTDAEKARAIFDTIDRTGKALRVTFNYRYSPIATKARELVMSGVIGKPLAVDFAWVLDTSHGADYFRRWHREKDKSGGLLVHKATHHFDLINWWIDSRPETVFAFGDLKFYGRENAEARGERYDYDRYTGHEEARNDPFAFFMDSGEYAGLPLKPLYLDAEKDDGYIRDRNVFGDDITAEDTMAVTARYKNGVLLSYSLLAYSPWEGFRVSITGDKGRMEVFEEHGSHLILGQSDEELAAAQEEGMNHSITILPMFEKPYEAEIPEVKGGHGGADPVMLKDIFSKDPPPDPFARAASHVDGASSILMGISANESIRTGLPVHCDDLLPLPE